MSLCKITKSYQLTPTTKVDVVRETETNKLPGIYITTDIPHADIHQNVSISTSKFQDLIKILQDEQRGVQQ